MKKKHRVKSRKLKMKSLEVAILLTFAFTLSTAIAQESINTAGGNASGTGGSVSYSVGQVFCQTHVGTNGSVVEGVQQAFEISEVTAIEEAKDISLTISAYPNPTNDFLQLKVENENFKNLSFQLFDINGKLLQNRKITDNQINIDMSNLVSATYFVKIIQSNKEVKTFKIVKK
ncbi:MAG: T9SS type A sorting domain-containing protein [Bacteroidales bacterium]|nr:T9SS type A sorting domain-containing protein [Bacteroidales bacterium]